MKLPALAASAMALLACGGGAAPAGGDTVRGNVNVFAAASLTAAFRDEAAAFRTLHPGADVRLNFGGSAALVTQIDQGAPADVFASADQANMQKLVDAGNAAGSPAAFASNRLQIVVPAGNPKAIRGLADLAKPNLAVVLCAPAVPCGSYAGQALAKAGVKVTPRSQEQDVNAVLTKVAMGEADAGVVYVTDVRSAGARVQGVEIPDAQNVVAAYPVVAVKGSANPAGASAFVGFLRSGAGQAILSEYGFGKPAA